MRKFGEYDENTTSNWFDRQTPLGLFLKAVALVITLALFFGVIGFIGGWFKTGADIVSPENVKEQYAQIYEDYEALEAAAGNVCSLRASVDAAASDEERIQRNSQVLATEQNYRRIAATYDARWKNVFEAKVVGPRDTPTTAPELEEMTQQVC